MRQTFFILILFLFSSTLVSAKTWYTTGNSSNWHDTRSWSADSVIIDQRGIPAASDNLVIRHPLTLSLDQDYEHSGSLIIAGEGILEVLSVAANTELILSGSSLINAGILMTNLPVTVSNHDQLVAGTFLQRQGSQMLLGSSLTLSGKLDVGFENGNCGAVMIKGALKVYAAQVRIYGSGSWIVEAGYMVYTESGTLISDPTKRDEALASMMEKGLSLFSDIQLCALDQRGLAGTLDPLAAPLAEAEDRSSLIAVFPNPFTTGNDLTIDGLGFEAEEVLSVELRTMMGQQVLSELHTSTPEGTIRLTASWSLEPGQYIITIRGSRHLATQRLLRQ